MRKSYILAILALAALAAVFPSTADDPPAGEGRNVQLLDRGAPKATDRGGAPPKTHTGLMTATVDNLMGTPGVTLGAIMTGAPAPAPGTFHGYFFAPSAALTMISPGGMFPTSYQPFFVTGAYAFVLGAPFVGTTPFLGAGVAPGPFSSATGTWAAFTAVPPPTMAGVFSPGMIFGMKGIFPHSPAIAVPSGFGVACGFDPVVPGAVLGGLTPGTGGGKPVSAFMGPGAGSGLGPIGAPPATYVAGCFIAGATVPVELQSFSVEG